MTPQRIILDELGDHKILEFLKVIVKLFRKG